MDQLKVKVLELKRRREDLYSEVNGDRMELTGIE
jgi:hypothetical protein